MENLTPKTFESLRGAEYNKITDPNLLKAWLDGGTNEIQRGDYFVVSDLEGGFVLIDGPNALLKVDRLEGQFMSAEFINTRKHTGTGKQSRMFDYKDLVKLIESGKIECVYVPARAETRADVTRVLNASPWRNLQAVGNMELLSHPDAIRFYGTGIDQFQPDVRSVRVGDVLVSGSGTKRIVLAIDPDGIQVQRVAKDGFQDTEFLPFEVVKDNFAASTFNGVQLNQATSVSEMQAWLDALPQGVVPNEIANGGFTEYVHQQLSPRNIINQGLSESDFFQVKRAMGKKLPFFASHLKTNLPVLQMLIQKLKYQRDLLIATSQDSSKAVRIVLNGEERLYAGTGNGQLMLTQQNGVTIRLQSERSVVNPSQFTPALPFLDHIEAIDLTPLSA